MDEYYTFYISLWRVFNKGRSREKNDQEKKEKKKTNNKNTYTFKKKNKDYILNLKHILLFAFVILLLWLVLAPKGNVDLTPVSKITETGEKIAVIDKINEIIEIPPFINLIVSNIILA